MTNRKSKYEKTDLISETVHYSIHMEAMTVLYTIFPAFLKHDTVHILKQVKSVSFPSNK